jgi:hypothetical protein
MTDLVKVYTGANGTVVKSKPIPKGTFVKDGKWQYTFLCENCLIDDALSFEPNGTSSRFAFVVVCGLEQVIYS